MLYLKYAAYASIAALTIGVLWTINGWREDALDLPKIKEGLRLEKEMRTAEKLQCDTNKEISEEVSNEYQIKLTDLNQRLNKLLRDKSRPTTVTVQPARKTGGSNVETGRSINVGTYGSIDTEELYYYASDSEKLRLQVIALQDFINTVWGQYEVDKKEKKERH